MIPSVPIIDCFQKIRQQVKCYLQMAGTMRKQELQEVSMIGLLTLSKNFGSYLLFPQKNMRGCRVKALRHNNSIQEDISHQTQGNVRNNYSIG